ncbi:MAG: hypothetical protein HOE44_08960 [Candidatus Marinimicrobia bacterium]|nr:hypothetical protein [Candidatus Neomarinimicrobiota bacterium]
MNTKQKKALDALPQVRYSRGVAAKSAIGICLSELQSINKVLNRSAFFNVQNLWQDVWGSSERGFSVYRKANPYILPPYSICLDGGSYSNLQRTIAMCKLMPVTFHSDTLHLVDYQDQPYVPMKAIVNGMDLVWQGQHKKLQENQDRWKGITLKVMPLNGKGGDQETLCLPLRKLPGWMMTLQPSRVSPEKREKIIQYQNECDDVLWEYWSNQQTQSAPQLEHHPLTPAHQLKIRRAVEHRAKADGTTYQKIYRALHDTFEVSRYQDIQESQFTEAMGLIQSVVINPTPLPAPSLQIEEVPDHEKIEYHEARDNLHHLLNAKSGACSNIPTSLCCFFGLALPDLWYGKLAIYALHCRYG